MDQFYLTCSLVVTRQNIYSTRALSARSNNVLQQ